MRQEESSCADSPAALVAIIRAARLGSDRDLERAARRELAERFGIRLTFQAADERQVVGHE